MRQPQPERYPSEGPQSNTGSARRKLMGLNIGHLLADFYGIFPAPLLRSFGTHLGVSYSSVSLLLGATSVANGLAGVFVGLASDRWKRAHKSLILLAAAVTVLAMSSIGIAGSYGLVMLLMAVGSFACAAFHPPGFSSAGDVTHPHRSRGVSIIMAAGIAGGGIGPLFVTYVVRNFGGVSATPFCALPGVALLGVAAVLLRGGGEVAPPPASQGEDDPPVWAAIAGRGRPVLLLFANATLRAFAHVSILVLISELMENAWGLTVVASGIGVAALQVGAGLGGLVGASLTPPDQERRTILACVPLSLLPLLPMAFLHGRAWWLVLLAFGVCNNASGPVVISLAQRIASERKALVSGLMVGLAFAVGGQLAVITSPRILASLGQEAAVGFLVLPLALCWLTGAGLPRRPRGRPQ